MTGTTFEPASPVPGPDAFAAWVASLDDSGPVDVGGLGGTGVLGAFVPDADGGRPWTFAEYAEACRLLAGVSASAQSLLTVHGMVTRSIARWAPPERRGLLPELASGRVVGAFALTDETAGSDISHPATRAEPDGEAWRVSGTKRWLCSGLSAGVFLVFAASDRGDVALLVHPDDPGVSVVAEDATAGFATAGLARLQLDAARIRADRLLARPGFALTQVAVRALDLGRLCVAAGAVGVAEAALASALAHITSRQQFGGPLAALPAVRSMITESVLAVRAARAAVGAAAGQLDAGDRWAVAGVLEAKLAATRAATQATRADAQLHGAQGLLTDSPIERRVQDARVFEVIEGNTQLVTDLVAEQTIARWRQETSR